jgi:thymidylate synthase
MAYADKIFKANLQKIVDENIYDFEYNVRTKWTDGTPAHTLYTTAICNTYDIAKNGLPITTLRPVAWKTALRELLWIWQDKSNDVNYLRDRYDVKYWDAWKNEKGTLGKAYGYTAAKIYPFPDTPSPMAQLDRVMYLLKNDPMNRRIMTNLIEFEEMKDYTLTPCAFQTMWSVRGEYLDMTLVQRSNDFIAANSINAVQYAFLLYMVAQSTGYKAGKLTHFIQNAHVYDRHFKYISDLMVTEEYEQPGLYMDLSIKNFYDFGENSFKLIGYRTGAQIKNIPIAE